MAVHDGFHNLPRTALHIQAEQVERRLHVAQPFQEIGFRISHMVLLTQRKYSLYAEGVAALQERQYGLVVVLAC